MVKKDFTKYLKEYAQELETKKEELSLNEVEHLILTKKAIKERVKGGFYKNENGINQQKI